MTATDLFSIATESADLAVQAFENAKTLEDGRNTLIFEVTKHGRAIARIAQDLLTNYQLTKFLGIDFSLAPFPDEEHSLGTLLNSWACQKSACTVLSPRLPS